MSQNDAFDLTDQQRKTLLQGLRFVRSSLMLSPRDPDPNLDSSREQRLQEITMLAERLNGAPASPETSRVS